MGYRLRRLGDLDPASPAGFYILPEIFHPRNRPHRDEVSAYGKEFLEPQKFFAVVYGCCGQCYCGCLPESPYPGCWDKHARSLSCSIRKDEPWRKPGRLDVDQTSECPATHRR